MSCRRDISWSRLAAVLLMAAAPCVAAPTPPDPDEGWLSWIVLDELQRCPGGQAWGRLGKKLEAAALARLACGRLDRLGALTDIVYAARVCTYLPMIERGPGGRGLARWLLARREVGRRLFRALEETKSRQDALRRFAELHAAEEAKVVAYADLAVAFAAAEPLAHYRRQPDPASLVESFRYYTDPARRLRHDMKAMPFEVLRYLADTRLSLAERDWAATTYNRKDPVGAYFHVKYDMPHFEKGRAKRIDSTAYTLANLAAVGGVCLDRAYYAAEVCKAVGMPAAIVHGRGGAGVEHAWFAYCRMRPRSSRAKWTSRTGRFQGQSYFVGTVRNPADGKMIYDSELMLLGTAARLPLRRREEADAATTLACLVDGRREGPGEPDLAVLRELAEAYTRRRAGKDHAPGPQTQWIGRRRKIDRSLLEDLLATAVTRNLAYRPAWRLLVKLRKADRIGVEDLNRFFSILIEQTGERYPDFSCLMVMQIVPTIPDPAHRREVYDRAITVYGKRPDLKGRLLIALGDDLRERGLRDEALATYRRAATHGVRLAEVVVQAARRAEQLLVDADRRETAIRMYRELFSRTRKQDVSDVFRAQTSHFQLGSRLADLLAAGGEAREAKRIRARL